MKKYPCRKLASDPTYSPEWSGKTGAPLCPSGCACGCGKRLHLEGHGAHYCPHCDDFKAPRPTCRHR